MGLDRAMSAHAVRNMLAEWASVARWSKVQPMNTPPHFRSVTLFAFKLINNINDISICIFYLRP